MSGRRPAGAATAAGAAVAQKPIATEALAVEGLTVGYGAAPVVRDLTLTAAAGGWWRCWAPTARVGGRDHAAGAEL